MKKLIALAAAAMMLLSLFTACGKEPAANNDNDTEKTTTFTVGFDAEFPAVCRQCRPAAPANCPAGHSVLEGRRIPGRDIDSRGD